MGVEDRTRGEDPTTFTVDSKGITTRRKDEEVGEKRQGGKGSRGKCLDVILV